MPKCLLPRTDSLPFLLYIFPRLICQTFFFLTCFRGDYWNMMCYVKQLTRTTTIPHGPLDILQVQEQVRHRGGDRRAHRGSNPGRGRNKSHG
ncbi:hypothetical protein POPTR_012G007445v4 [Populus trichocarpa]|uniref:Protein kinase domain-containing protein n=1 Tax=Populus trichocarpa TaxID=3694 RepID=A0A2K1Y6P8_POPTR|nr:hypothetical protein POPTR_012G007445v4 [Populus trichocarpa]